MGATKPSKPKVRDRILHLLKKGGPQESGELAEILGISAMAVRQHLYGFQECGWVDFEQRSRPVGRPAKLWKLTEKADSFFPDRHNDLLLSMIDGIEKMLSKESLNRLLENRASQHIHEYRKQLGSKKQLANKVSHLAELRSREGYMAEVDSSPDGGFLLIENHCPICQAARVCQGLCDSELVVFRRSLGEGVAVDRIEHLLSGQRRCVYHIKANPFRKRSAQRSNKARPVR